MPLEQRLSGAGGGADRPLVGRGGGAWARSLYPLGSAGGEDFQRRQTVPTQPVGQGLHIRSDSHGWGVDGPRRLSQPGIRCRGIGPDLAVRRLYRLERATLYVARRAICTDALTHTAG